MKPSIGTVSGREINYREPDPNTFEIEDIAIGLSHVCRFAGQLEVHYSVGQHSVNVAHKVYLETGDHKKALQGLLHDASEAFTGDVPTPLKREIGQAFTDIENRIQKVIYDLHGLPAEMFAEVHAADKCWLIAERDQLQPRHFEWGAYADIVPYQESITPWGPRKTQEVFLSWYYFLTGRNIANRAA